MNKENTLSKEELKNIKPNKDNDLKYKTSGDSNMSESTDTESKLEYFTE